MPKSAVSQLMGYMLSGLSCRVNGRVSQNDEK
jgi:hypothetical protein